MTHIANCTDCLSGYYCQDRGSANVTAQCDAGHICYGNALSRDPVYNNDTSNNLTTIILYGDSCHPGYYCPQGTSVMIACPRGTYNPDRNGKSEVQACKPCDPGYYCNGTALTAPTGNKPFNNVIILEQSLASYLVTLWLNVCDAYLYEMFCL